MMKKIMIMMITFQMVASTKMSSWINFLKIFLTRIGKIMGRLKTKMKIFLVKKIIMMNIMDMESMSMESTSMDKESTSMDMMSMAMDMMSMAMDIMRMNMNTVSMNMTLNLRMNSFLVMGQ